MAQSQTQEIPLDELVDGLASIKRMGFKVGLTHSSELPAQTDTTPRPR